jgi:hypothetical protein
MSQKKTSKSPDGKIWWLPQVWWVPIIVAVISLVGILISIQANTADKTLTPQPNTTFDYLLRVQTKDTGEPISNARVTIEVAGQAPIDEITDSNGIARIFVNANYAGQPGRLIVEVVGYKLYRQEIDIREASLPDTIQLEQLP